MTNPTPKKRRTTTEDPEARRARTAVATATIQRRRHERMAAELAFFGYRVFRPEDAGRAPLLKFAHLSVQAPETIEELGPKVNPNFRSPARPPARG